MATVDRIGGGAPRRLAPLSPLAARVVTDSIWSRAIGGTAALALPVAGIGLGLAAVLSVGGAAVPPGLGFVTVIVALSVLDSLAGAAAAAVFCGGVVLCGGVSSADSLRGLLGIGLLFFAVPLIATAARPLRRPRGATAADHFDRAADVVIVSLIAAWSAEKLLGALPGLARLSFPVASHGVVVAEAVLGAAVVRMVGETAASWWYPARLDTVLPEAVPEAGTVQQLLSIAFQTALLLFIAVAFLGNVWELWVGAALFAGPQLVGFVKDRLPNVPWLVRALPAGIVKTTTMMVVGTWFARLVASRITNPATYLTEGFVVLSLPGLALTVLAWFGRDGKKWQLNWVTRVAGIGVLTLGVLMVQKVVSIG